MYQHAHLILCLLLIISTLSIAQNADFTITPNSTSFNGTFEMKNIRERSFDIYWWIVICSILTSIIGISLHYKQIFYRFFDWCRDLMYPPMQGVRVQVLVMEGIPDDPIQTDMKEIEIEEVPGEGLPDSIVEFGQKSD